MGVFLTLYFMYLDNILPSSFETCQHKTRDQNVLGNVKAAHLYSHKAKWYNILASGWNVIIPLLIIVLIVTGIVHLSNVKGSYDFFGEEGYDNFGKLFGK
ncbi:Interferon-induced transmembrane protein 5 [Acipenser ruthenus]|uniref:Interferon-induced transmembrane protein 5 n=1 Tax=Acipenser ruthenus TaxID=7906 RepID=A0A444UK58_ACIRT|nr:Interferon-induced transmembrane protein 5 [Acipenser ruthenus]